MQYLLRAMTENASGERVRSLAVWYTLSPFHLFEVPVEGLPVET